MKKVFFFSTLESVPWGGSEQLWSDLATHLLSKGHEIITNTIYWPQTPHTLSNISAQGGIITLRPNAHISSSIIDKAKNKIDAAKWKRVVESFNPDVILISAGGTFDNAIQQHGEWLLSLNKPVYVICQYLLEYEYIEPQRRAFFVDFIKHTAKIFFVSERNRQVAEKTLAINIDNAATIKNPIKLKEAPTTYPATDVYNIAVVARLELPVKGFDILYSVFSQPEWANRNFHINIYGTGLHEQFIKELCAFHQLDSKITFQGFTDNVKSIWEKNHIMLLPSRGEGTPLSLLEAGYCKRAAVVTDVGGNAEIIKDGINGFVADAPVVKCVSDAMERAWLQRNEWQQMGEAARKNIDKLYNGNPIEDLATTILA